MSGFEIIDADGQKLGQVERICYGRNSLRIEGWCTSEGVALARPGQINWEKPDILRVDVNTALGLRPEQRCGFNIACFGETQNALLSLKNAQTTLHITCPNGGRLDRVKAQAHIRLSFAKDTVRAAPKLLRAFFFPNVINRQRAKHALRMGQNFTNQTLDPSIFDSPSVGKQPPMLTLIMPVFNAADVLELALTRVAENTDIPWRMILVEDCSTDQSIRPFLRDWSESQRMRGHEIHLIENDQNLGFIRSVNRAFKKALEYNDHVVLLNSDALVPKDWTHRLLHPILKNARVASVTLLSNDAEIFTVPVICERTVLIEGVGDKIDCILHDQMSVEAYTATPTGVGFCMAINIKFLRKRPEFDTIFGRGYGEEVDWCQQVTAFGGLHMCQPALFVEHRGGASFGNVEKQAAIARNSQIVSKRYPQFDQMVQHFIGSDPLRSARLFAGIAHLAASQESVKIYIAHSLGGGAELYLKEKISEANAKGTGVLVLRVGGTLRWRVELHHSQGIVLGDTLDSGLLHKVLKPIKAAQIIYSCAVGDGDPMNLIDEIMHLRKVKDATLRILVHDYFMVSPSYCLLNSDGVFWGIPESKTKDPTHSFTRSNGKRVSNTVWRKKWNEFLNAADRIICFSDSSKALISSAFPRVLTRVEVAPHALTPMRGVRTNGKANQHSIGVLGDIGYQKGARVLSRLSTFLPAKEIQSLAVIGRVDPQFLLDEKCIETGSYTRRDIPMLAEKHGVGAWLIPSIWPETFSYTTHEALATGLPVICFDIGAQGEAVAKAVNGYLIPVAWADDPEKILTFIQEVLANGSVNRCFDSSLEGGRNRGFAA